ncbi:MAG: DUF6351 family protein [Actinomycetota bacterium]|nr:DUF6351 family protein [Actinomycetota bacterium]
MRRAKRGRPWAWLAAASAIAVVASPLVPAVAQAAAPAARFGHLALVSVSNPRPELVSGGEVLIRVRVPRGTRASGVRVTADGTNVSRSFQAQPDGSLLGLVTGLRVGRNVLVASARNQVAALTVTDHAITGPVFSGKQQLPFFCETTAFGLAAATMPDCSAPAVVSYDYFNTTGAFVPLADPASRPADLATATVHGTTVPFIVRVETGTIDRAVYQTAALYDGHSPTPLRPDTSWNGKLVYTFGGGCDAGFHQGTATGGVLNNLFLGQGYAVASSTLNVLDTNCSTIISAEAAMMVKEHFIDAYGPVKFTIGWGLSGGAIQQYEIADSYPGIVNGIIPGISFPDPLTTGGPVTDCRLLDQFFAGAGSAFTPAEQKAIAGYNDYTTCKSWDVTFSSRATATGSCNAAIPLADRWNAITNPHGVICNSNEQIVNQVGVDAKTGFPNSALDNTGVQYGLAALKSGAITPAQFAVLNAAIGGLDFTGAPSATRSDASLQALNAIYADDLYNGVTQGLRTTPVIDARDDLDAAGLGSDIHTTDWSFIMRARLRQFNGTDASQVIIESLPTAAEQAAANQYELSEMDAWLTNIDSDHSGQSLRQKVAGDKPAGLSDGCYLSATNLVHQTLTDPGTGPCSAAYPVASNPRMVAGEGLTMTALKCNLQPLNFASYPVSFTAAEKTQLEQAFPSGACDYSKAGVGFRKPIAPWLSYGDSPTSVTGPFPLPPPPAGGGAPPL